MKKIIALILTLSVCLCFAGTAYAADTQPDEQTAITENTEKEIITGDENNDELNKIISAATQVATYIYNFATKPEEPAVDLETVIKIVSVAVYIIYGIVQQYTSSNA